MALPSKKNNPGPNFITRAEAEEIAYQVAIAVHNGYELVNGEWRMIDTSHEDSEVYLPPVTAQQASIRRRRDKR